MKRSQIQKSRAEADPCKIAAIHLKTSLCSMQNSEDEKDGKRVEMFYGL